ncbi:MAG: hypothetical protein JWO36_6226, partial [Myxococcales bacterium]|nr:hypothetical protein [Myxococcales bacterium]
MIRSPLLVIACVLTAMQTASADPRRVVAVLDVHVDGVAPEVAAQFQSSLEAQVDA